MRGWLFLCALVAGCGRLNFDRLGGDAATSGDDGGGGVDASNAQDRIVEVSSSSTMTGTTSTVTFTNAPAIGDLIVASAWTFRTGGAVLTSGQVTDDAGNGYQVAVNDSLASCDGGSGGVAVAIYYTTVVSTMPSLTLTLNPNNGAQEFGFVAIEVTGLQNTRDTAQNFHTLAATSPQMISVGPVAATAAPALLVSVATACSGNPDPATTWTELRGFNPARVIEGDTTSHNPGIVNDLIVTTPGSYDEAWAFTYTVPSNQPAIAALAAFR